MHALCYLHHFLSLSGPDVFLAACDERPLFVGGASCALEHVVPSALLFAALPLLGHHLQQPHDL